MNKIFDDAADKNVSAQLVYKDASNYACSLSTATEASRLTKAELMNAFLKRCFVVSGSTYMIPTELVVSTNYCSVVCAGLGASGADITIYSKEYTAPT